MKTILLTGGAGFIGSHTSCSLLARNAKVIILDSYVNSYSRSIDRVLKINNSLKNKSGQIISYFGDVRNKKILTKIFNDAVDSGDMIDGVIHFAGLKSVDESIKNRELYEDVNIKGTKTLISVMRKFNCKKLVFSSSATIYGNSNNLPLKEEFVLKPINPYGETKLAVEELLEEVFYKDLKTWSIANLRYFNPIGAHESGLIGDSPKEFSKNIFPLILDVCIGNLNRIQIFGNDWPTRDGTPIRDYIHVMDIAEGHICVLEYLFKNQQQFFSMNLGTGRGTSVLELISVFEDVNGVKVPYVFSERRNGDSPSLVADNSLALSKIDWKPKRDLRKMCRDGWNWKLINPDGFS